MSSTIDVRFRADVHLFRDVPHSTPAGHYTRSANGVGTYTWNFQGQQNYPDGSHTTLQGSGSRTLDVKIPLTSLFNATFNVDKKTVAFLFNLRPIPPPTTTTTDANGNVSTGGYNGIIGTSSELAPSGQFPMATLGADLSFQGSPINHTTPAVGGASYQTSLTWNIPPPLSPPDPNAARSVQTFRPGGQTRMSRVSPSLSDRPGSAP